MEKYGFFIAAKNWFNLHAHYDQQGFDPDWTVCGPSILSGPKKGVVFTAMAKMNL